MRLAVRMTPRQHQALRQPVGIVLGRHVLQDRALPKMNGCYEAILADRSVNDATNALHYRLKMLKHLQQVDAERHSVEEVDVAKAHI
jgi:hypothetical protein